MVATKSNHKGEKDQKDNKSQSIAHFQLPEQYKTHTTLKNQTVVSSLNKLNKKKGKKKGKQGQPISFTPD